MRRRPLEPFALLLTLGPALLVGACTAQPRAATPDAALRWPAVDPRVRLVRVLPLDELAQHGGGRVLGWLTGSREASGLQRPHGVAWRGDDLVVTDPPSGTVLLVGSGGRVEAANRSTFSSPVGVAACGPGILSGILITDSAAGKLALLDGQLRLVRWLAEDLERPTGIACAGDTVFVAETGRHRIVRLDPDGTRRTFGERGSGPGQLNFPTAVALGPGGALWIGDTLNFRIQELDPATGAAKGSFGRLGDAPGDLPRIKGIAIDPEGHLWVTDAVLDRVELFDPDGTFLMDLGRRGEEPGELSFPAGIAGTSDGRMAVVDSLNRRLQIFELLPEPSPSADRTGGSRSGTFGGTR